MCTKKEACVDLTRSRIGLLLLLHGGLAEEGLYSARRDDIIYERVLEDVFEWKMYILRLTGERAVEVVVKLRGFLELDVSTRMKKKKLRGICDSMFFCCDVCATMDWTVPRSGRFAHPSVALSLELLVEPSVYTNDIFPELSAGFQ